MTQCGTVQAADVTREPPFASAGRHSKSAAEERRETATGSWWSGLHLVDETGRNGMARTGRVGCLPVKNLPDIATKREAVEA